MNTTGVEKFAQHLAQHPELMGQKSEDLARQFDLDRETIESVLSFIEQESKSRAVIHEVWSDLRGKFRQLVSNSLFRFDQMVESTPYYVFISTLFLGVILSLSSFLGYGPNWIMVGKRVQPGISEFTILAVLGTLSTHWMSYFRKSQARNALIGSAVILGLTLIAFFLIGKFFGPDQLAPNQTPLFVRVLIPSIVITLVYTMTAVAASILGGSYELRKGSQAHRQLTRQELLGRLLELREKLESCTIEESNHLVSTPPRRFAVARANLWWIAIGSIIFFSYFRGIYFHEITAARSNDTKAEWIGPFSALGFELIYAGGLICLGFLAGSVRLGLIIAFVVDFIVATSQFLPFQPFGQQNVLQYFRSGDFLNNTLFHASLGMFAGMGARIEEKSAQHRRIAEQEYAALVGEWIRIKWALTPRERLVSVLAVDVKNSSRMKRSTDPLVAEYSFRAYQNFVAEVVQRWSGSVHAVSGDGAVVAFPTPNEAFAAAREILRGLDDFNHLVNKLETPFRVRIGLHQGQLQGEINDVQFTRVIDIAAHIEALAPVGGIAMSEAVAKSLEGERLAKLSDRMDDIELYVALNPTGA